MHTARRSQRQAVATLPLVNMEMPAWVIPAAAIALCLILWQAKRMHSAMTERSFLRTNQVRLQETNLKRAHAAFDAGAFADVVAYIEPATARCEPEVDSEMLLAGALEALREFGPAADAYERVLKLEEFPRFAPRAAKFCRVMEVLKAQGVSEKELDNNIVEELLRREQEATARYVARRLAPDYGPLRKAVAVLLTRLDPAAKLTFRSDKATVDIALSRVDAGIIELLRDFKIGSLSMVDTHLVDTQSLAGLDVQSLDLTMNPLTDLSGLDCANLRTLNLSGTNVAEIRNLAPLQIRELNLAHTNVTSLYPVATCPLQTLNLAGTSVRDFGPLQHLGLKRLDLSKTQFNDLSLLAGLPIEELHLDNSMIYDLQPLAGMKLRVLSIAGTAVKDLSPLSGMPLVELDLRGCEMLSDLDVLASCSRLQRLSLPSHLEAPVTVAQLPSLKSIDRERARVASQRFVASSAN